MFLSKFRQLVMRRTALISAAIWPADARNGCAKAYRRLGRGQIRRVGVFLNHPPWIMLGDQFWFEPLLHGFQANGIDVVLDCTGAMRSYFQSIGYMIAPMREWKDIDVCVTRIDLAWHSLVGVSCPVIAVDTSVVKIAAPVCQAIVEGVFGLLGLPSDAVTLRPRLPDPRPLSELPPIPPHTVFVNDRVGSGGFRVWHSDRARLWKSVRERKASGASIACVGSKEDRAAALPAPDLIDLDLRGEVPLVDLMRLCESPSVDGMICFDGFLSHLFEAAGKDVEIHYRRQFTTKKREGTKRYYHPPFPV